MHGSSRVLWERGSTPSPENSNFFHLFNKNLQKYASVRHTPNTEISGPIPPSNDFFLDPRMCTCLMSHWF